MSSPTISEFLLFLFDQGRQPSTIEGYRTAIAGALRAHRGVDFGTDPKLSALLRSLHRERPKTANRAPSWDLALVLWTLTQPPFEPIRAESTKLKWVTLKTVFLILLASGSRRGEIHALSFKDIEHSPSWDLVTLRPIPGFVSKTQLRTSGASAFQGISFRALSTVVDKRQFPEDCTLCPVRALKVYLHRTSHIRQGRERLFISYQEGRSSDICKNTISGWVRKLIERAYKSPNEKACTLANYNTRDIRGMAASWASRGTLDLEGLMRACTWKSHTTFTDFYLKDLSVIRDNLLALGPIVAAQSIVHPSHS